MNELYNIHLEEFPDSKTIQLIKSGLSDYNQLKSGISGGNELIVSLRDERKLVVGGLIGFTYGNWLHIQTFWVRDDLRKKGFGSHLLTKAEKEAVNRGCRIANLETFGFQAPKFYMKKGYELFGEIENAVGNFNIYFFRKKLASEFECLLSII